ncbi:hypothetical protein BO94DRAFT_547272 [Aspergillus sclerotioniger CBS 115572]|uniref:Uncharacterized protein n=1 Tax=Aspergillus sclerotioniger CBS 115572 TaxID=1450535 RepID=A0A317WHF9_9EURO|nr:hypothetical protein BO94DRAFT_547272 [Aspergillus sclerotioniger CBS 115572]PWY84692.1 hypothetical protein BO94DRAFT_547272 [Aspergillus sclerotioniger CBS 115572]
MRAYCVLCTLYSVLSGFNIPWYDLKGMINEMEITNGGQFGPQSHNVGRVIRSSVNVLYRRCSFSPVGDVGMGMVSDQTLATPDGLDQPCATLTTPDGEQGMHPRIPANKGGRLGDQRDRSITRSRLGSFGQ